MASSRRGAVVTPERLYKAVLRTGRSKGLALKYYMIAKITGERLAPICQVETVEKKILDVLAGCEQDAVIIYYPVFTSTTGEMFPTESEVLNFVKSRTFLPD